MNYGGQYLSISVRTAHSSIISASDFPDLSALIDVDEDKEIIFGNDFTVDDIVWMGPQPTIKQLASKCGIKTTAALKNWRRRVPVPIRQGRKIHFVPQYRYDTILTLHTILDWHRNGLTNTPLQN